MKNALGRKTLLGIGVLGFAASALLSPQMRGQVPESILDEDPTTLTAPRISDRLEPVNRVTFKINDGIYRFALRPIAKGYAAVVPSAARRGIRNFFSNLGYPTRLVGNILQGRGRGALIETGRFLVNTTAGVGGFVAVADTVPELRLPEEDIGQAFGAWGIGHGSYLILPLLGPSSLRDGVGDVVSGLYLAPTQYLPEWEYRATATGVAVVNSSPEAVQLYDNLKSGAVDPYIALRDAYSARRAAQLRDQDPRPMQPQTGAPVAPKTP